MTASGEAIRVDDLVVRYGQKTAVNHLSFSVKKGEIYGLLGPNGAGKTSTIKALIGLTERDSGTVEVLGRDIDSDAVWIKGKIGVVPENPVLFDSLTPNEFLELVASLRKLPDMKKTRSLVTAFEFDEFMDTPIASLSMGNKQKVTVIAALMHGPEVLILDEPFNGLDVRSVRIFKDLLVRHTSGGGAVLFSTHIMDVAERICNEVGIIDQGAKVAEGTMEQLKASIHGSTLEEVFLKATNMEKEIDEVLKALE
jgi:ABC-2 type transport system ATP-binding protein